MNNMDTKILILVFGIIGAISFFGIFAIVLCLESNCIDDLTAFKMAIFCIAALLISWKMLEFTEDLVDARKRKKKYK